jgi:hypothetical protein
VLSDGAATPNDLAAHYEQLRRDVIDRSISGSHGLGLALFLRHGMTTWMQAWSEASGSAEPEICSASGVNEIIPPGMRSQLTSLLTNMILSLQQEATA